jgi:hypothetical protein
MDVAVPDGSSRPGMAIVVRLPSGRYVMSFEVCGRTNCEVHVKTSPDGDTWGAPADLGPRVQTANGHYAGHTPYLTWVPAGGPQGTLVLAAQDLFGSDDLVAPESRQVLLINRRGALGPWSSVPAPLQVPQGGPLCANYSSALLPSPLFAPSSANSREEDSGNNDSPIANRLIHSATHSHSQTNRATPGTRLLMVAAVGLAGGGCAIHYAAAPLAA